MAPLMMIGHSLEMERPRTGSENTETNSGAQPTGSNPDVDPEFEEACKWLLGMDRFHVVDELRYNAILVLEFTTHEMPCKARFCFPEYLSHMKTKGIVSPFRLNLVQKRNSPMGGEELVSQEYYHVTCMEYILGLKTLIESQRFMMVHQAMMAGKLPEEYVINRCPTKSLVLEDWFAHNGSAYSADDFDRWISAYTRFYESRSGEITGCPHSWLEALWCTCPPEFGRPTLDRIFPARRTPWVLSELLASLCGRKQVDNLPDALFKELNSLSIFRYDGLISQKGGTEFLPGDIFIMAQD